MSSDPSRNHEIEDAVDDLRTMAVEAIVKERKRERDIDEQVESLRSNLEEGARTDIPNLKRVRDTIKQFLDRVFESSDR